MTATVAFVQRSFRLSGRTSDLLDALADSASESRNSLVERLLAEALRTERHPLIRFRTGAAGRREPCIVGTRLLVRQLMATVRDSDGIADAGEVLGIPQREVQAAVAYYADYRDEVDADAAWAHRVEADELARWQREQAVTA